MTAFFTALLSELGAHAFWDWIKSTIKNPILPWRRKHNAKILRHYWHAVLDELNQLMHGQARLVGFTMFEPQLIEQAGSQIPEANQRDPIHAILVDDMDLTPGANIPTWHYRRINYSTACSMRAQGQRPALLTGNAILCCSKKQEVYVHLRRPDLDTMPKRLHFFGGKYICSPRIADDEESLRHTTVREVAEETRAHIKIDHAALAFISVEEPTGFIQLVYPGVDLAEDAVPSIWGKSEGRVVVCPFHQLENLLRSSNWVESGRMAYLAWLALGAPLTSGHSFGSRKARAIYRHVIRDLRNPQSQRQGVMHG